jgi:hypothetical protein
VHVPSMREQNLGLHWVRIIDPQRARVKDSTCWRCGPISYELITVGGAHLIRRTETTGGVKVWETGHGELRSTVLGWWSALTHKQVT